MPRKNNYVTAIIAKVGEHTPQGDIWSEEAVQSLFEQMRDKGENVNLINGTLSHRILLKKDS